jgi:hypothetical protein
VRQETRNFFKKIAAHFKPEDFAEALAAIADFPVPESDNI